MSVSLDPAGRTAAYRADGVIDSLRASYANLRSGPVVAGEVHGIRDRVEASWELGARSAVTVKTASTVRSVSVEAASGEPGAAGSAPAGAAMVRAVVRGARERVALSTDGSSLTWDAAHPVPSVTASARATVAGRPFRATAKVTGVPEHVQASWGAGGYRLKAVGGAIGQAALAVTNHDGATAPTGPHLAAHYDRDGGDLDASVLLRRIRAAQVVPSDGGFTTALTAAATPIALDADLTQGDDRFGALGTLTPGKGAFSLAATDGVLRYTGTATGLRGRAWAGKRGALAAMKDVPGVEGGVSVADAGCAPGTKGCAGGGAFCPAGRPCFGLRARLDLTLPDTFTVDPGRKTFTFTGYRPRDPRLRLHLDSTVLAPVPIRATATLTGLPRTVTSMAFGPFDATQAAYKVEPAVTLGSLDLRAESGDLRGSLLIDPLPAAVAIQASYGAKTRVRVRDSAPVKRLAAKVTVAGKGSAELRLGDVPATFAVDADASAGALRAPALTYTADTGTLDGFIGVERGLTDPGGRLGDIALSVRDLAQSTTLRLNPDQSLDLASKPGPTGRLEVHAGLNVEPVARQRVAVAKEVPHTTGFLNYQVGGDFSLGRSTVEDLSLSVRRVSWLKVRPGKVPFGLKAPAALGFLAPGFEGAYDRLDVRATGVDLRPDVRLAVRLSRKVGADLFRQNVRMSPVRALTLRRYDQRMRLISGAQRVTAAGAELACVTVGAKPGFAGEGTGRITLRGSDGPQMISLLDPGGQAPAYAVDLLTHFMSPFAGSGWEVSGVKAGKCPA